MTTTNIRSWDENRSAVSAQQIIIVESRQENVTVTCPIDQSIRHLLRYARIGGYVAKAGLGYVGTA